MLFVIEFNQDRYAHTADVAYLHSNGVDILVRTGEYDLFFVSSKPIKTERALRAFLRRKGLSNRR